MAWLDMILPCVRDLTEEFLHGSAAYSSSGSRDEDMEAFKAKERRHVQVNVTMPGPSSRATQLIRRCLQVWYLSRPSDLSAPGISVQRSRRRLF